MTKQLFNMNFFSWVIKGAVGIAALLLSAILSYTFFLAISPANMAVFPFAALSLTEGGFLGWILIFSMMKHHKITSVVALFMIGASFVTTITVTFAELIQLFQDHSLVSNDTIKNGTLILLEVMLGLHILAVASDFLVIKIEWLVREYLPQQQPTQIVVEQAQHQPPALLPPVQQLLQSNIMSSQPSVSTPPTEHIDTARWEAMLREMAEGMKTRMTLFEREAVRQQVIQEYSQQQPPQNPLQSPQLDTASQPGSQNGNGNGHQKSQV